MPIFKNMLHPTLISGLPDHDAGIGCHVLLLKLYSMGIWRRLLALLDADGDGQVTTEELKVLDIDGDGKLSKVCMYKMY